VLALPVLASACGGGSGGGGTKSEVVTVAPASGKEMMSGEQMDQLQAALAKGVAQGPLASTTTTTAG
jgi:hypothetical protein